MDHLEAVALAAAARATTTTVNPDIKINSLNSPHISESFHDDLSLKESIIRSRSGSSSSVKISIDLQQGNNPTLMTGYSITTFFMPSVSSFSVLSSPSFQRRMPTRPQKKIFSASLFYSSCFFLFLLPLYPSKFLSLYSFMFLILTHSFHPFMVMVYSHRSGV